MIGSRLDLRLQGGRHVVHVGGGVLHIERSSFIADFAEVGGGEIGHGVGDGGDGYRHIVDAGRLIGGSLIGDVGIAEERRQSRMDAGGLRHRGIGQRHTLSDRPRAHFIADDLRRNVAGQIGSQQILQIVCQSHLGGKTEGFLHVVTEGCQRSDAILQHHVALGAGDDFIGGFCQTVGGTFQGIVDSRQLRPPGADVLDCPISIQGHDRLIGVCGIDGVRLIAEVFIFTEEDIVFDGVEVSVLEGLQQVVLGVGGIIRPHLIQLGLHVIFGIEENGGVDAFRDTVKGVVVPGGEASVLEGLFELIHIPAGVGFGGLEQGKLGVHVGLHVEVLVGADAFGITEGDEVGVHAVVGEGAEACVIEGFGHFQHIPAVVGFVSLELSELVGKIDVFVKPCRCGHKILPRKILLRHAADYDGGRKWP